MPIKHLRWNATLRDRLHTVHALETMAASHAIIVGPGWVDIASPGELQRQIRRGRVIPLTVHVYRAMTPDLEILRETLAELAAVAPERFAAADRAFRTGS